MNSKAAKNTAQTSVVFSSMLALLIVTTIIGLSYFYFYSQAQLIEQSTAKLELIADYKTREFQHTLHEIERSAKRIQKHYSARSEVVPDLRKRNPTQAQSIFVHKLDTELTEIIASNPYIQHCFLTDLAQSASTHCLNQQGDTDNVLATIPAPIYSKAFIQGQLGLYFSPVFDESGNSSSHRKLAKNISPTGLG